jgi:hypothetical protein
MAHPTVSRCLASAIALTGIFSARALAQESPPLPPSEPIRWSVEAGYGHSVKVNRGNSKENLVLFIPSADIRLGPRLEWTVEGHVAQYFTPSGYMLGVMPVGARYFFGRGATLPYFSIGAGLGWTDLVELDEIDRRFNFLLQASAGIRHRVGTRGEWTLEARWDHISNGGTELPNLGLNSVVLLFGWRFR